MRSRRRAGRAGAVRGYCGAPERQDPTGGGQAMATLVDYDLAHHDEALRELWLT
jgi:hypothetical protein